MVGMSHDDAARQHVAALWHIADQLVRARDGEHNGPIEVVGQRLGKGDRTISTTRVIERLIVSQECCQLLDGGIDAAELAAWLNERVIEEVTTLSERGFLGVAGVNTATQLHEWVDAQLHEVDD